jgi:hypothetical protein
VHTLSAAALPIHGLIEFSSGDYFVSLESERSYTAATSALTDQRLHYGEYFEADAAPE